MHDCLLSVVLAVNDAEPWIPGVVSELSALLARSVRDYEIVVVDNGSSDATVEALERAAAEHANVQVYCLPTAVDRDVAFIAGLENAIGEYIVLLDPLLDDIAVVPELLDKAVAGNEIVLARPRGPRAEERGLRGILSAAYIRLFRWLSGLDLRADAPRYRLISRRVANYVLQHDAPFLVYQVVPVIAGFRRTTVEYDGAARPARTPAGSMRAEVNRGVAMLVSISAMPMRLVSLTCLAAALFSVLYSVYVVVQYLFNERIAPGWTTLSLQMSVMFFLLSIALAVLSEYVIRISQTAVRRPLYYITREFRSPTITRELRLNVLDGSRARSRTPET